MASLPKDHHTAEKIPEFKIRNDLPAEFKQELKSILFRLQLERVIDGIRAPG
jgi:hypothetical protein